MILDGKKITGRADLHDMLKAELGLPEHYGRNLDALNDCLSELKERPEVRIVHQDELCNSFGRYADRLIEVFVHNGFTVSRVDESSESVYNEESN